MALSIAFTCGESPSLFMSAQVFLLRLIDRTLNGFKIGFAEILTSRPCIDPVARDCSQNGLDDLTEDFDVEWARDRGFGGRGDPQAVYNVLDGLLKGSLERLRTMRENISIVGTSNAACISRGGYTESIVTLRRLCTVGEVGAAVGLRKNMIKRGIVPDIVSHNYLISALCKSGKLEMADSVLREMSEFGPRPNRVTYNSFIKGCCRVSHLDKALYLLFTMVGAGIQPNRITCNTLVRALCNEGRLKDVVEVFGNIINEHSDVVREDVITSTILMDGFFKNGDMVEALRIWSEISKENKVDLVAYNVLVHGFCSKEKMRHAYASVCKMLKGGFTPDVFTYNTLISGHYRKRNYFEASQIHNIMCKQEIPLDQISYKTIIRGLCLRKDLVRATEFLVQMLQNSLVPDPLIWNCLIDGYGKSGNIKNAFFIRDWMQAIGVASNVFTYNALIRALLQEEDIDGVQSLRREMLSNGVYPDVVTYNLLIGSACSLGYTSSALQLFDEMKKTGCQPDKFTYSQLIRGYCDQGEMHQAEKFLTETAKLGIMNSFLVKIIKNAYHRMRQHEKAKNFYVKWMDKLRRN